MLSDNIRNFRTSKGLSQEELARQLHVVRQTVSKWEKGISVPDAELLIRLAQALDVSVGQLLDENEASEKADGLSDTSEKLEALSEEFSVQREKRRKFWHRVSLLLGLFALFLLGTQLLSYVYEMNIINSGVIGGADGPTAILVAGPPPGSLRALAGVVLAVAAGIGLYKTRR